MTHKCYRFQVPFLPTASIFVNIYLMAKLSAATWVRFSVWLSIGALIYGFYGWRNASEEYKYKGMVPPNQVSFVAKQFLRLCLTKCVSLLGGQICQVLLSMKTGPIAEQSKSSDLDCGRVPGSNPGRYRNFSTFF